MSLNEEKPNISKALNHGLKRFFPVLGVGLIITILMVIGAVIFVIPALIVTAVFAVSIPATVVEKTGVFQSLTRSSQLTKGQRWRVFGTMVIAGLVWAVPIFLISFFLEGATKNLASADTISSIFDYVINSIGSAYFAIVIAVTYHKLRSAKEGLNSKELAAVFD